MHWALVGPAGHCEGVLTVEGGDGMPPPAPAGLRVRAITQADSLVLRALGHHAVESGQGWDIVPEQYGRRLDRSRGLRADHAAHAGRRKLATLQSLALDQRMFSLLDDDDVQLQPPPSAPWNAPTGWGPAGLQIRQDLQIRHMTEAEVDDLARVMLSSGAYDPWSLDECWTQAHSWWSDSTVWALTLDWAGRPLQYELIHFDDKRSTARGGFVSHLSKERPSWFWRECSKPLFQKLMAMGYTKMSGHVRPDRKDWADSLAETYGAQNMGLMNGFWTLRYDLATMIAQATGWRTPETAGAGWETTAGIYRVREGSLADLPEAIAAVRASWAGRPRGAYAEEMLHERLELDAGTLVLGYADGVLRAVWPMRWKAPGVLTWGGATMYSPSPDLGRLYQRLFQWAQAAGFATITMFVPEANWTHPLGAYLRLRSGMAEIGRVTVDGNVFVETSTNVAAMLARPPEAWVATP